MKRRTVLASTGVGLSALGVWHYGATGTTGSRTDPETDDEPTEDQGSAESDRLQLSESREPFANDHPYYTDDDAVGHVELYGSADAVFAGLDFDEIDDERRDTAESLVEETEFDPEALLYVSIKSPDLLYEVVIENLETHESTVTGSARAEAYGQGGLNAVGYPAILVRITDVMELPERAEVTVSVDVGETETELVTEVQR